MKDSLNSSQPGTEGEKASMISGTRSETSRESSIRGVYNGSGLRGDDIKQRGLHSTVRETAHNAVVRGLWSELRGRLIESESPTSGNGGRGWKMKGTLDPSVDAEGAVPLGWWVSQSPCR